MKKFIRIVLPLLLLAVLLVPSIPVAASSSVVDTVTVPFYLVETDDYVTVNNGQFIFRLYKDTAGYTTTATPEFTSK